MDRSDFPDSMPPSHDEEEEEKKRARSSGAGDVSPAHAQLGANIRPDVVSGPAGLETITTQKSKDYRPDIDAAHAKAEQQRDDAALDAWMDQLVEPSHEADREALFSEIAAHQYVAREAPLSDEGFLNFVQAVVKADSIRDPSLPSGSSFPGGDIAASVQDEIGEAAPQTELEALEVRQAEESTKRQENERRAEAGEELDPHADISHYIDALARDARSEAEAEREEEQVLAQVHGREPGDSGPTRGGGGGRGR